MADPSERLAEMMRAEARSAEGEDDGSHARLLRHLADTMDRMTPAERTWVGEASEQELSGFVRALRVGCPPD